MSAVLNPVSAEPSYIELSVDNRIRLELEHPGHPGHRTRNQPKNQIWFQLPPHALTVQEVMEAIKMAFNISGNIDLYLGNSILMPCTDARIFKVNESKIVWVVPKEDCDVRMTKKDATVPSSNSAPFGHGTLSAANSEAGGTTVDRPDAVPCTEVSTNGLKQRQSDSDDSTSSDFHFNSNKDSVKGTRGSEEVAMEQETFEPHTGTDTSTGASESGISIFGSAETGTESEIEGFERIKRKISFSATSPFEDSDSTPSTKKFKGESPEFSTDTDHSNSGFGETTKVRKIIHVDQTVLNSSSIISSDSDSENSVMGVTWRPLPIFNQEVVPSGSYISFDFAVTNMSDGSSAEMIPVILVVQEFTEAGVRGTVIRQGGQVIEGETRFFEFQKIRNPYRRLQVGLSKL